MRVITGSARGVRIDTLEGEVTRPTSDRVKQALFNMLQFDIEGRSVLDIFAGSGQLGIEALSRGAKECVFLDSNQEAAQMVQKNLKAAKLFDKATVLTVDAMAYCKRMADAYDIVFMDPPYASDFVEKLLPIVAAKMNVGGTIVCETNADKELEERILDFVCVKSQKYGNTRLWIYRREGKETT